MSTYDPKDRIRRAKAMGRRALSFHYEGLESLPPAIKSLNDLLELNLAGNALKNVPQEILALAQLEFLYLDENRLSALPDALWSLTALRDLGLGNSVTIGLGNRYGRRSWRDADGNRFETLPAELGGLSELRRLAVGFVGLRELPQEIGALKALRELDVAGNALEALPKEIAKLKRLETLDLSANPLTDLPDGLTGLTGLRHLRLGDVPGEDGADGSLPELAALEKLETLDLPGCGLSSLPDWVLALKGLRSLSLADNPLADLPDGISGLTALTMLDLSGTDITEPPRHLDLPAGLVIRLGPQRLYRDGRLFHAIGPDGEPIHLGEPGDEEDDEETLSNPTVKGGLASRVSGSAGVVIHQPGKPRDFGDDEEEITQAPAEPIPPAPTSSSRDDEPTRVVRRARKEADAPSAAAPSIDAQPANDEAATQVVARSRKKSATAPTAPEPPAAPAADEEVTRVVRRAGKRSGEEPTQVPGPTESAKPKSGLAARVRAAADDGQATKRPGKEAPTGDASRTGPGRPVTAETPTAPRPKRPAPSIGSEDETAAPAAEPSTPAPADPPADPPADVGGEEDEDETITQERGPDGKPLRSSRPS